MDRCTTSPILPRHLRPAARFCSTIPACALTRPATRARTMSRANGSGVKQITYSATGAQSIPSTTVTGGSASINITTDGQTTLTYFARDNAGNSESPKTLTIKLDKHAPNVSCGSADGQWHSSDV